MRPASIWLLAVVALSLVLLGACGDSEPEPSPSLEPGPIPTAALAPEPTETPVPDPTATPEPTSTPSPEAIPEYATAGRAVVEDQSRWHRRVGAV